MFLCPSNSEELTKRSYQKMWRENVKIIGLWDLGRTQSPYRSQNHSRQFCSEKLPIFIFTLDSHFFSQKMSPNLILPVFLLTVPIAIGIQYQSNERFLYLFTTTFGNVHENYAYCIKMGMLPISVGSLEDEKVIRREKETLIDWIWISSTIRTPKLKECKTKCCSLQMKASGLPEDPKFRNRNCTDNSGYIACQQVKYYSLINF